MLKLTNQSLPIDAQTRLDELQEQVNQAAGFSDQVKKAGLLWNNKNSSVFNVIKQNLVSMTVGSGLCNYCEQNEASDIEHILPKGLLPEHAFRWDNYLLACKQCNTGCKLDRMFVFDPANSSATIELVRGQQPVSQDYAFIHPRNVDPLDYLLLDFDDFQFMPHPPPKGQLNSREFWQAEHTLDILGLNKRDCLVKQRKQAFTNFKNRLNEYAGVKKASTHSDLEQAVMGDPKIDHAQPFLDEQERLLTHIKQAILDSEHPTVWREMIRQRMKLSIFIQNLFQQAPEALSW